LGIGNTGEERLIEERLIVTAVSDAIEIVAFLSPRRTDARRDRANRCVTQQFCPAWLL